MVSNWMQRMFWPITGVEYDERLVRAKCREAKIAYGKALKREGYTLTVADIFSREFTGLLVGTEA
jgi:hypothetical protein